MAPQSMSTTGEKPPIMSPGKSARFSELVSIITSTARSLQDEFDFLAPEAWTEILDHMFPGATSLDAPETTTDDAIPVAADGKTIPSGMSAEILAILENEATREAKKLDKVGKAPVFGNGSAPSARASAGDISDEQRRMEWSLIVRYGDPRAPMSDEHYACLRVAIRRWWSFSPPLEVLRLARKAAEAQFRLVGAFGPGMLPFNTAIWHKATYDGQCKYLDKLIADGDARGVTAMEAFLGKLPAPKAPVQDDVVCLGQKKAAPKTTSKPTSKMTTLPASQTASKKRSMPEPVHQIDSDSDGPVVKRRKPTRKAAQKSTVIDLSDSQDEPDQTAEQDSPSLIVKLKIGPRAVRPRINSAAPDAVSSRPRPLLPIKTTQDAPGPKKKYIYKVEAELTQNPRTNALISFLVSTFYAKNRKVLANSPWAMEKVRRYAQGKEPHVKGPGQTSMLEIGFFEGRDLSWSLTGFQLDQLAMLRKEAKAEWEAKNAASHAVDLTHDEGSVSAEPVEKIEAGKLLGAQGNVAGQSKIENDGATIEDANEQSSDSETSTRAQDDSSTQSDPAVENKEEGTAVDIHMSDSHDGEQNAPQADQNVVSTQAMGNDEGESATTSGEHEDLDIQAEDVDLQPANKVSTPAPETDLFDLFTTINDTPSSAADQEDIAAANQLLTEQHQQRIRSSSSPEHTFRPTNTMPTTATHTATDTQDIQMQTTSNNAASQASSSSLSSRSTTPHASSSSSSSHAAASDQQSTYSQNDDSSDNESEWHDAVSTTEEM